MLHSLKINNVALIKELTMEFENNLNILTGETGAGKSIIIDSLNFLLGARADKTLIRSGETDAKVVGVFSLEEKIPNIVEFFEKLNIELEDTIIISRQMNINGKSLTQVNGEFITANMLKELTPYLLDIHGQNEHQFILSNKNQLSIIDDYNNKVILPIKNNYKNTFEKVQKINASILSFGGSEEERLHQIDLLEYEVNEITNAKLNKEEEEELSIRLKKMQNVEKIANNVTSASHNLENLGEGGVIGALSLTLHDLNSISSYDKQIEALCERLNSVKIELEDGLNELKDVADNLEFNQNEFDSVDERLDEIRKLKRKYGGSIESALEYLEKSSFKLNALKNSKEELDKLNLEKQKLLKELLQNGVMLQNARRESANLLSKVILNELIDLGMPNASLEVSFSNLPTLQEVESVATRNGLDSVEFLFSANLGEPVKPLNKIISGGEMSRFMLALKTITIQTDLIPTMVFDEIDAGISGKMAQAVSKKLAKISKNHQVIVVSHLPQIAAMADYHFYIEKGVKNDKTLTEVHHIEGEDLINEIARMLSAEKLTETSKNNARELKENCNKFKLLL